MSNDKQVTATFGSYGRSFQEKIVQALLVDKRFAEQMMEVFETSYLELKYLSFLAERYFTYAKKYKVFPTLQLLVTIIKDELKQVGTDIALRDQIVDYLQRMRSNPDPGDLQYVKEKALDFCRKQALKCALEKAVDQMQEEKYEQIVEGIKKAVCVGTTPQLGHDFFNDYEARFTKLSRNCVPTGFAELDKKDILNGGLGAGEIGIVIAATGVGKCVTKDTTVRIKHKAICVTTSSGSTKATFAPWELDAYNDYCQKEVTVYGNLYLKQSVVTKDISIGDLFKWLKFDDSVEKTDANGDSFIKLDWCDISVEADGPNGKEFYPIEGLRWTAPEKVIEVKFHNNVMLRCSPDHYVAVVDSDRGIRLNDGSPTTFNTTYQVSWIPAKDLKRGDKVVTDYQAYTYVDSVEQTDRIERLCDLQVGEAKCYYTNGILSHNSHFLAAIGANALRNKVNVVHYTLELSETAVGVRYDSNLCDIDSNLVIDNKNFIIDKYKNMDLGRLIIKEFPTNSASIYTLRSHIERLELKGFTPGMIIIDYADIMRSTRQYDSLRHELKLIYEELRGFANEKQIPIWTASQSNKEGANSDIVDLTNMSESYGKAMVADVVLSLSRKSQEKALGIGRLFVAKNRAGRDGLFYPIKINTARSTFEITGTGDSFSQMTEDENQKMKQRLKEKWDEVRNDPELSKKESIDES